jgi:hypothetical protein
MGCTKAPTDAERIAQIDAQLASWVSTGDPADANTRLALRSERTRLAAALGIQSEPRQDAGAQQSAAFAQANAEETERQRIAALQQENYRNIEQRQAQQADRERQQTGEARAHSDAIARKNDSHRTYSTPSHRYYSPNPPRSQAAARY